MNGDGEQPAPEFEDARNRLRARWELASVLNFLKVFEPLLGSELKVSAEEIEASLILPDKCLRLVHIVLLKGIPPVSKNLKEPDAWVVTLSKKLFMWWPWVAEGEFPLTAAKGAEMETYKNLDPTVRLVILKALCEIRADQHDAIAFVNDAVRTKNEISTVRKKNIAEDGKGTSYWLDGNETIGLRLYKEINTLKENVTPPTLNCQWETLATDLEEFQKIVAGYSSSKSKMEVAVSAAVETEAIPLLNKLFKKKQRGLQKKKHEERIINNFSRSVTTRACRNRTPITYTFDEYDKVISEAIRVSKRTKTTDEPKSEKKGTLAKDGTQQDSEDESTESDENDENSGEESDQNVVKDSGDESDEKDVAKDSGDESDDNDASEDSGDESDEFDVVEDSGEESDQNDEDNKNGKIKSRFRQRIEKRETEESEEEEEEEEDGESTESDSGSDCKSSEHEPKAISENDHGIKENKKNSIKEHAENGDHLIQKMESFGTKKRLVQRPTRNTAIESAIVPDSEDEISSDNSDD